MQRGLSRAAAIAAPLASVLALAAFSVPGLAVGVAAVASLVGGLAAVAWIAAGTLAIVAVVRRRDADVPVASYLSLAVLPLAVALTAVLVELDVPLRVGFAVSRHALERIAHGQRSKASETTNEWAGIYWVREILTTRSGVTIIVAGPLFEAGFAYLPDLESEAPVIRHSARHFDGDWYLFQVPVFLP